MKLATLAVALALVIAAPAAMVSAEALTWTLVQPTDGPLSLDGGRLRYHVATPAALAKAAAGHASARVVYGKAYFRFTARYRTTGQLAPTVPHPPSARGRPPSAHDPASSSRARVDHAHRRRPRPRSRQPHP